MNPIRFLSLMVCLLLCVTPHLHADMKPFVGQWGVDVPATLEEMKKSPKYNPDQAAQYAAHVKKMSGQLLLTVAESQINIDVDMRTRAIPYKLVNSTEKETQVAFDTGKQKGIITFVQIGNDHINFKSTASEEMNIYVWKRSLDQSEPMEISEKGVASYLTPKETDKIQENLRTILSYASTYALENGLSEVTYDMLIKAGELKPLKAVKGEDYTKAKIDLTKRTVSVTDNKGTTHTLKR
jgi:hypothetical protein